MDLESREGEAGKTQSLPFIEQSTIIALKDRIKNTGLENLSRGILLDFAVTNRELPVSIAQLIVSAYEDGRDTDSFERGLAIVWHAFKIQFLSVPEKLRGLDKSDYEEVTNTRKLVFPDIPESQAPLNGAIKDITEASVNLNSREIKIGANFMYQFLGATWNKLKP